ncbi:hypothetical protein EYF80_002039 [Liparis tanakae]|uniref:Uncharacterized protein n=1 Tax=Liparis tanakae TaxID=230148 RepID=A0A4Z2JEK7_9TELE|nr:hypothetical protein EYF80_002039 [Liparis tanakae]
MERGGTAVRTEEVGGERERGMRPGTGGQAEERREEEMAEVVVVEEKELRSWVEDSEERPRGLPPPPM